MHNTALWARGPAFGGGPPAHVGAVVGDKKNGDKNVIPFLFLENF